MVETTVEPGETWTEMEVREAERLVEIAARACEQVLVDEGSEGWVVSLTLTSAETVHALNRMYRHVDRPTDVLSFSQREGEVLAQPPEDGTPALLGDVIVALEVARAQAAEYGHSLTREVAFLAVHGTLHLLGYDHEEPAQEVDMMARAERALERLGLTRTSAGD